MKWIKRLFLRRRMFGELSVEIRAHLEEKIEELLEGGMSRKEAEAAARRQFGNVTLVEEDGRDVWRWLPIENLFADVRYSLRMLRRNPVFAAVGLLTIAIGIGANAAVFSVVNSVLLKPLNYPKAEELVSLHQTAPGAACWRISRTVCSSRPRCISRMRSKTARFNRWVCGTRARRVSRAWPSRNRCGSWR